MRPLLVKANSAGDISDNTSPIYSLSVGPLAVFKVVKIASPLAGQSTRLRSSHLILVMMMRLLGSRAGVLPNSGFSTRLTSLVAQNVLDEVDGSTG